MNTMYIAALFGFVLLCSSCSTVKQISSSAPIPLATVRLPITIDVTKFNAPITSNSRCYLNFLAEEIKQGKANNEAKKSAITMAEQYCFSKESEVAGKYQKIAEQFDTFDDLCSKDKLVFVAISGGGARAAALGSHAMALLEKEYNEVASRKGILHPKPMIDLIDVFSTVSGGSMYAYQVSRLNTLLKKKYDKIDNISEYRGQFFQKIDNSVRSVKDTGFYTSIWYLSPGNLGYGPLLTLATNYNYLHILAGGLNYSYEVNEKEVINEIDNSNKYKFINSAHFYRNMLMIPHYKISELSDFPRVCFNSTLLETGLPFMFTQRYVHAFPEKPYEQTVRLDLVGSNDNQVSETKRQFRPFKSTTLEDINSSPESTELAYATVASAAFPIMLEPFEVMKYGYRPVKQEIYATSDRLHLSDGGIYDNSGLTPLIDLMEYLISGRNAGNKCNVKRIVLLSINADADSYNLNYANRDAPEETWFQWFPVGINLPFRWRSLGFDALNLIHFTNKRRAEQIAIDRAKSLRSVKNEDNVEFNYLTISLQQLSGNDKYRIADISNLYDRLKNIPTNYQISNEDSLLLEQAALLIISASQPWGKDGEKSLKEKFIEVIMDDNSAKSL